MNAPRTDAGRAAWQLFRAGAWRVRIGGMGYIAGVETEQMIGRLVRNGIPIDVAEDLIAGCEQGFVMAMNRKEDDDGEPD